MRNSHQPSARDDLQTLNMAATFFATLVPADGPCNYARLMTRMSTCFERIARTILDRDQKSFRPAEAQGKASRSRPVRNSRTSPIHSASSSTSTDVDAVPNLEGLPPINSSGYVVPASPSISPAISSNTTPSNPNSETAVPAPHQPSNTSYEHQNQQQQNPHPQTQTHTNTNTHPS